MIFIDYLLSYLTVDGLIILVVFLVGILTSIVILIGRYFFKKISTKIEKMNEISKKYYNLAKDNEKKIKDLEKANGELKQDIEKLYTRQLRAEELDKLGFIALYGAVMHGVKNGTLELARTEYTKLKSR